MRFYVPKVLCSEGSIFRNMRFYVPKVLYSECPIFRRFYVPKNGKIPYSEGSMFRKTGRFYIPKVLCSELSDFVAGHHLCGWVSESK